MTTKQLAYVLFGQTVILLMFTLTVMVFTAIRQVEYTALTETITFSDVHDYEALLHHLLLITGLMGGGMFALADDDTEATFIVRYAVYGWALVLVMTVVWGSSILFTGDESLTRHFMLLHFTSAGIIVGLIAQGVSRWSSVPLVWLTGTVVILISSVALAPTIDSRIALLPMFDDVRNHVEPIVLNLRLTVGYVLAGLALIFWLMRQFSDVSEAWAERGLFNVAGMLTISGILVSIAQINPITDSSIVRWCAIISTIFTPLVVIIFASHCYRALADRRLTVSLARHWVAFAVLAWLAGLGGLGGLFSLPNLFSLPGLFSVVYISDLNNLRVLLIFYGTLSIILAMINEAGTTLRGDQRRITGLMPYWFFTCAPFFGWLSLAPTTYAFELLGVMATAFGVLLYAIGFWVRRPLR